MSTCPKCQKELDFFEYNGIELLKCSDCNGFWFKNEKFREAKQAGFSGLSKLSLSELPSEEPLSSSSSVEEMRCPDCQESLVPYAYAYSSEIQLYRCRNCQGIWADYADLVRIEELLTGYKESLDEAKAKALPLMLKVKKQIQQEERAREEERKRSKKGLFNRIFRPKDPQNRKVQNIFDDNGSNDDKPL